MINYIYRFAWVCRAGFTKTGRFSAVALSSLGPSGSSKDWCWLHGMKTMWFTGRMWRDKAVRLLGKGDSCLRDPLRIVPYHSLQRQVQGYSQVLDMQRDPMLHWGWAQAHCENLMEKVVVGTNTKQIKSKSLRWALPLNLRGWWLLHREAGLERQQLWQC